MDEYEIECTGKFEGVYTPKEIELNKKLYEECTKEVLDCDAIEELLKRGADPIGATAVSGWGILEHIYGEIVLDSKESNSVNLPRVTELFLKYGMDVDNPRVPYDGDNSIHPMWKFSFLMNENAIYALKMLLDKGLSADAAGEMWGHTTYDLINIECGDPNNDEFWNYECTWAMKIIMLCASYDHILNNDEDLRNFIGCSYNNYDLHKFRNWNDFYYRFDTSHCTRYPEFYKSVVKIFEKENQKEIWKIGICLKEGEF